MCAVLHLETKLFYLRLKFNSTLKRRGLMHTNSCANAIPESIFPEVQANMLNQIVKEEPSFTVVRMASGQKVTIKKSVKSLKIGLQKIQIKLPISPTMNSPTLGYPF